MKHPWQGKFDTPEHDYKNNSKKHSRIRGNYKHMKDDIFIQLIDESIKLELAVSELYQLFHIAYPEDSDFWWQLMIEEKGHAAILRSGKENFLPLNKFPKKLVSNSLHEVSNTFVELENLIKAYKDNPPSRTEAFNNALKFEMSAGEVHFQEFLDTKNKTSIDKIFQKLINSDKNHVSKLLDYMKKNNVEVEKYE